MPTLAAVLIAAALTQPTPHPDQQSPDEVLQLVAVQGANLHARGAVDLRRTRRPGPRPRARGGGGRGAVGRARLAGARQWRWQLGQPLAAGGRAGRDRRALRQDAYVRCRSRQRRKLARIAHLSRGRSGGDRRNAARKARPRGVLRFALPRVVRGAGPRALRCHRHPRGLHRPTGEAHWHVLQRARAIEASAYVVAAAQVGRHADGRTTYGHSLVVDPWGKVLLDMGGDQPGLGFAEIDLGRIAEVRRQVPSLANRREIAK